MTFLPRAAITATCSAISAVHANRWLGEYARGDGIAWTLHRVRPARFDAFQPNVSLEITPAFLSSLIEETRAAGFEFVAIDDALQRLQAPQQDSRPFAVLTFDDGYRDNLEYAAPILRKCGVPWTMFVVPDFLDGASRLWWLEIELAVAQLQEIRLGGSLIDCRSTRAKRHAFESLRRLCHRLDDASRLALCDHLAVASGQDGEALVRTHCLDWDEVSAACRMHDLTIGSHTKSHAILANCPNDEARRQITESRLRLQAKLGLRVNHLAYPHGTSSTVTSRENVLANDAGYTAAWTTKPAHLISRAYADAPFALPRVSMNGAFADRSVLRAMLSGIPFLGGRF